MADETGPETEMNGPSPMLRKHFDTFVYRIDARDTRDRLAGTCYVNARDAAHARYLGRAKLHRAGVSGVLTLTPTYIPGYGR